jgi:hypothetical protein
MTWTRPLCCYRCGGSHPWSVLDDGTYVIKCPNAADPKICKNAKATIDRIRKKYKKDNLNHEKKNLTTANFADYDNKSKKQIHDQALQSIAVSSGNGTSVNSSIIGTGNAFFSGLGQGCGRGRGSAVFMYNLSVLTTQTSPICPILPVSNQSLLLPISLQLRTTSDKPNAPMIRCMVDTGAALKTGNCSFYPAIAKRYLHCVAKVFLPKNYSPIILLGVINDDVQAITTDLSVVFQFHVPYLTRDESMTSIIIATSPQVSMNAIIGLPFIKATGMIINTVDYIVEAKHLVCKPFRIEFCRTTKYVPAISDDRAAICYIKFEEIQSIIATTYEYIATVAQVTGRCLPQRGSTLQSRTTRGHHEQLQQHDHRFDQQVHDWTLASPTIGE